MQFILRQPLGYSYIGRKEDQEDAVWPAFEKASAQGRVFVLCDGVGGSDQGEVASQNASRVIGETLTDILMTKPVLDASDVQLAIDNAYEYLESIDKGDGSRCTMATTLTVVCLHENGVLAAHMGDSRIYLIRPATGMMYQSSDHSLVNMLVQAGELTPEEAKTFPRKNVITKAIQPHAEHFKAEVHNLTDIQSGDYLFLCSDGVLEQVSNDRLVEILALDLPDREKIALLEKESKDKTRDNYTAYLIPIQEVTGVVETDDAEEISAYVVEADDKTKRSTPVPHATRPVAANVPNNRPVAHIPAEPKSPKSNLPLILVLLAAILALVWLLVINPKQKHQRNVEKGQKEVVKKIIKDSNKDASVPNEDLSRTIEQITGDSEKKTVENKEIEKRAKERALKDNKESAKSQKSDSKSEKAEMPKAQSKDPNTPKEKNKPEATDNKKEE